MTKNYFTYYKYPAVIFIVGVLFTTIFLIQQFGIHYGYSVLGFGFLAVILEIIDRYLWKYPPFSWMFIIKDFSGTYEGEQIGYRLQQIGKKGKCKEFEAKLYLKLIIHQTGSKLIIHSFYYNSTEEISSKSNSEVVGIRVTKGGQHYKIIYNYLNEGNERWNSYYGTTVLKLIKENKVFKISGNYYTNRKPQTHGKFINLTQKSKKTIHPF